MKAVFRSFASGPVVLPTLLFGLSFPVLRFYRLRIASPKKHSVCIHVDVNRAINVVRSSYRRPRQFLP